MARTDKALARAYSRTQQTRYRLEKAIAEGAPAKRIAKLQGDYERQRHEYKEIKFRAMKI